MALSRQLYRGFIVFLATVVPVSAHAFTPIALGAEFQANSYTSGSQERPSTAMADDGAFVVVWMDLGGHDGDQHGIQGQRYASDGAALGVEFTANSYTTSRQEDPDVGMDSEGNFVVVWYARDILGASGYGIFARQFASDGSAQGPDFQVNSYTTGSQRYPHVALDADGDFVVAWHGIGSDSSDGYSVQARRFGSDGSPRGGEFHVNSDPGLIQYFPSVALDSDGDFVVASYGELAYGTDTGYAIQAQRFASDGSRRGESFQVNTYATGTQSYPTVALQADGAFVIVWMSAGSSSDSDGDSVQGQRYASDGSELGTQFQINSFTTGGQSLPSVGFDGSGDFVVVWDDDSGMDGSFSSVRGLRYSSNGLMVGSEFQANSFTTAEQQSPDVAVGANGALVIIWEDARDGSLSSVHGQRFTIGDEIFADGFESADPTAWSTTVGR